MKTTINLMCKNLLIILLLLGFASCTLQRTLNQTEVITFKPYPRAKTYTMSVPVGYRCSIGGGDVNATYWFIYGKQCLEISNEIGMLNLLNSPKDSIYSHILFNEGISYCDTVVYFGKEKTTYWKEYRIYRKIAGLPVPEVESLIIGYRYVSRRNKALFDSCLLSVQPLANTSIEIDSLKKESLRKQEEWFASKKYQRSQQKSQKKFLRNLRRSKS